MELTIEAAAEHGPVDPFRPLPGPEQQMADKGTEGLYPHPLITK
jgi:hypothetical protein